MLLSIIKGTSHSMNIRKLTLVAILTIFNNSAFAIQGGNPTELSQEYMASIVSSGLGEAANKYIGKTES